MLVLCDYIICYWRVVGVIIMLLMMIIIVLYSVFIISLSFLLIIYVVVESYFCYVDINCYFVVFYYYLKASQ